jgi:hypothetical protein
MAQFVEAEGREVVEDLAGAEDPVLAMHGSALMSAIIAAKKAINP